MSQSPRELHEQFTIHELYEFRRQAEHAHSWGNRCLAVELGEIIVANATIDEDDDTDYDDTSVYELVGDAANAYLEDFELEG